MTKYIRRLDYFTLIIIIFIFYTIGISEAKPKGCRKQGHLEFFPEYNQDNLFGVVTFTEVVGGDRVVVNGLFSTIVGGVDGIKTEDGQPRYTAELYDTKGAKLYDLTVPIFHNAMELVSFNKQYANLQICNEKNSIIGKMVVIKRDGNEIARAEIYEFL